MTISPWFGTTLQDDAKNDAGLARPNLMAPSYFQSDVLQPLSPQGGRTAGRSPSDRKTPKIREWDWCEQNNDDYGDYGAVILFWSLDLEKLRSFNGY